MINITHNDDGYTINCLSFYDTGDVHEITNIKELQNIVVSITEEYFNNKFGVMVSDDWHYGCTIELLWCEDPLDGTMSGNMPIDFMLDKVNKLCDEWGEVYYDAYMFADENSKREELEEA